MHISETRHSSNTILTKCTKMTEEKYKRHGMNGNTAASNADLGAIKDTETLKNNYVQGGRLKFFKDGKFILELERAREGERISWVSVPRKTFWPPQGTAASTPTYRQESSASLSVSDDNSSIQSSPWQRDHSWKQSSPRPNQSKELTFFFWRPKCKRSLVCKSRKLRRPYSVEMETSDSRTRKDLKRNCCVNNNCGGASLSLLVIVQNLLDKVSTLNRNNSADMVVSPRKRFLREMEKDKVQIDDGCLKRSRNKTPVTSTTSTPTTSKFSSVNGGDDKMTHTSRNCSYSITSLLAEDRNMTKRSPSNSPSHLTTAQDRWYSESVDRLRSIELSQADKRGYPYHHPPPSYLPHYMYPYTTLPPYYSPTIYGRGYIMPPVYHHTPPMPLEIRHDTPSCSWAAEPSSREIEHRDENITDMPLNLSKHAG